MLSQVTMMALNVVTSDIQPKEGFKLSRNEVNEYSLFINPNIGNRPFVNKKLFQTLCDAIFYILFEDIHGESSKLGTYALPNQV